MNKQAFEVAELPAGSGRWYWRELADNEFHGVFRTHNDASAAAKAIVGQREPQQVAA